MPVDPRNFSGLNDDQVRTSRTLHGSNQRTKGTPPAIRIFVGVLTEPMLLLLVVSCITYFLLGSVEEGYFMAGAILFVAGISIFQQYRSEHALKELGRLTALPVKVLRNGQWTTVPSAELVVDDVMQVSEGEQVNADGQIIKLNDLSIDESILSGESLPVDDKQAADIIWAGTTVVKGMAMAQITHVGDATRLGGMGLMMEETKRGKTPLERQVGSFVRTMAFFGITAFSLVWLMHYLESRNVLESLMHGLTLAMAVLPEEIPVALASFMALGAFRLVRKQVLARHPQTVEALGAATVICLDKTGTITENKMVVSGLYFFEKDCCWKDGESSGTDKSDFHQLLHIALLSSEHDPFDPMEKAILLKYREWFGTEPATTMVSEYPLSGHPPMMTHVHKSTDGVMVIAAKGAVETLLPLCRLGHDDEAKVLSQVKDFASNGQRVLAIAIGQPIGSVLPATQQEIPFRLLGLLSLSDPPKKQTAAVIQGFYQSGIDVKMITGDHPETALYIARSIGMTPHDRVLSGKEVMAMDAQALSDAVGRHNIFARIMPEAKLRIIEALRSRGEVVAMTGDGVNDAPALKAADIGVSMGHHGSEVARQASSLVLLNDQLGSMIAAIELGRTIYDNLKRAISYIIAIHIPLISIVTIPLLVGWKFGDLFTPVHIIFLELIMGPTCSIVFENEPARKDIMTRPPRKKKESLFTWQELGESVLRGLVITAALLTLMYFMHHSGYGETTIRTVVFTALVLSNILLTFSGRSEHESMLTTIRYRNILVPLMGGVTLLLMAILIYLEPAAALFKFEKAQLWHWLLSAAVAAVAVLWMEIYKHLRKS